MWPTLQKQGVPGTYTDFENAIDELFAAKTQEYIIPPICPRSESTPFLQLILDQMGVTHLSPEVVREISDGGWLYWQTIVKAYPGTEEMLNWVQRKGVKLAVVSNWYQAELEVLLEHLGLRHFFDCLMTSEKAETLKSNLKPFQLTLEALDVNPSRVLHVGDNISQDGVCRKLGIRFVYCTWFLAEHPEESLPEVTSDQYDFIAQTHQALFDIIGTLG
jgi:FMN phosphatase YigB (HAD superfamily)